MVQAKYIVVAHQGCELAIVFSEIIDHATVAKSFHKVVSAGRVNFYEERGDLKAHCFGQSDTLDLKSRPDDDSWSVERCLLK